MDPDYNSNYAKERLQAIVNAANIREDKETQDLSVINTTDYRIVYIDRPHSWRMIKADNVSDFEESVFQIYGILCGSDLPPIHSRDITSLRRKATYIRQTVRLTGLGIHSFDVAVNNVNSICKLMSTSIVDKHVLPWQSAQYESNEAIDASARYFTPRKFVPNERGRSFAVGVDPSGLLADIRGQDLIHGEDNKVDYLKEYKSAKGVIRLTRVEPSMFNIGDIVRAMVSFVVFPRKEKDAIMTLVLKALTHIESIASNNNPTVMTNAPRIVNIKRKIIYDEVKETSNAIDNMTISGEE